MTKRRFRWSYEELLTDAKLYGYPAEWQQKSKGAYLAARAMGILDVAQAHMVRKHHRPWTEQELIDHAKQFTTISEWQKKAKSMYSVACRLGIKDKCSTHMTRKYHRDYTDSELIELAAKFKTVQEWSHCGNASYQVATNRGILELCCAHMKKATVSWSEKELMSYVKDKFPKTSKLYVRGKQLVAAHPYINGFEIDIYVPELRKGIEFDGTYWHSKRGLKRSRSHWPEEALNSYHQIKDHFFLERGIEVLHIREEEYVLDKNLVLKKIDDFLRTKEK